jgi:hypothetical protein
MMIDVEKCGTKVRKSEEGNKRRAETVVSQVVRHCEADSQAEAISSPAKRRDCFVMKSVPRNDNQNRTTPPKL